MEPDTCWVAYNSVHWVTRPYALVEAMSLLLLGRCGASVEAVRISSIAVVFDRAFPFRTGNRWRGWEKEGI